MDIRHAICIYYTTLHYASYSVYHRATSLDVYCCHCHLLVLSMYSYLYIDPTGTSLPFPSLPIPLYESESPEKIPGPLDPATWAGQVGEAAVLAWFDGIHRWKWRHLDGH